MMIPSNHPNLFPDQQQQDHAHVQAQQTQIHPPLPPHSQIDHRSNPSYYQVPFRNSNDNIPFAPRYSSSLRHDSTLDQASSASSLHSTGFYSQAYSGQVGDTHSASKEPSGNFAQVVIRTSEKPRRGRPPKNSSDSSTQNPMMPKRRGRPPKDYTAIVGNTNSDASLARDEKSTPRVKKSIAQTDENKPKKRVRGRPRKQPTPEVELEPPNPLYLIYGCGWNDCPAELHNLATLRMHIFQIHGKRQKGMSSCLWKGCHGVEDELSLEPGVTTRHTFENEDGWKNHMEEKHILPYAWHMGDGPQNSLNGLKKHDPSILPAYMFDKNGVQVTPSVSNLPIEDGDPEDNSRKRFKRTVIGLDVVYDPIYGPDFETPVQNWGKNVQGNQEVQGSIAFEDGDDDEDEDEDEDEDMGHDSGI